MRIRLLWPEKACNTRFLRHEPTEKLAKNISVKRRYRVRENEHFQKIRRHGISYSDKLLVICLTPNQLSYSRFGFSISSRIGKAVVRNQIKRRLREAIRLRMDFIEPGWDIVFIARAPIRHADYHEMDAACARLLRRAHLLREKLQ
jgi:ribonuclease P protein component